MRTGEAAKFTLKAFPAVCAIAMGLCLLTERVAGAFGVELHEQDMVGLVRSCAGWNLMFAALVAQIAVLIPLAEEAIFRGALFALPTFVARRLGLRARPFAAVAAIASSALFAFAHYVDWQRVFAGKGFSLIGWNNAFLALFFIGMAHCWLMRRTRSFTAPALSHILFNTVNLVLIGVFAAFDG